MRRLGYGLLALVCLLALLPVATSAWRRWEAWRNLAPARSAGLDERVLFEARAGRPLMFNVSTNQGWFALQGFVVASPARRTRLLPVTVEIGLHGTRGVNRERRYLALPAAADARPYGALNRDPDRAVWVMPTEWIDLAGRRDVRTVSVRVVGAGDGVHAVLWRGAIDQRLPDAQVRLRYRRLSDPAREALTAGWITPPTLVEPEVKQELLRFRQQRVAPLGQPGEAFDVRRVLRQPPTPVPRRFDPRPAALAIGPSLDVALELDAPLEVVVDARRADGSPLPVSVAGPFAPDAASRRTDRSGRWRETWAVGRYVLRSAVPGDVEVRETATGDSLLPSGLRPRTQRVAAGRSADYPLIALDAAPPPVRLRLRPERGDASARVRFLDAAGNEVASRDVALPWRASRFDRLGAQLDRAVAEAVQVDLQPPVAARTLRLEADDPVLAHVLTTVPGDLRGRRWYSFHPATDPRSVTSQGIVVVEQPRPGARRLGVPARRLDPARTIARAAASSTRREARDPRPAEARVLPAPRLRLRPARADGEDRDAD